MAKNVARTDNKKTAVNAYMDTLAADAGLGAQDAGADDMTIPFLRIAQALSDEVDKRHSSHIKGLEVGDFFNSATQRVWPNKKGLNLIPVLYQRKYIEWQPNRGGYVQEHASAIMEQTVRTDGADLLDNGNEVVLHATWYCLVVDTKTGETEQVVVDLSKTQHKKSRQLVTKLKSVSMTNGAGQRFNPPTFFNLVEVHSVGESNDYGRWEGWDIKMAGNVLEDVSDGEEVYGIAKALHDAVAKGDIKAAKREGSTDGNETGEDIPF